MTRRLFAILLFALMLAPALAPAAPAADEAKIREATAPAFANVFDAVKAHDWSRMRRDFSQDLLENLSKGSLAATIEEIEKRYGRFASASFDRLAQTDKWILVYYTMHFATGNMTMQFTLRNNDPSWKIAGLIVRPEGQY